MSTLTDAVNALVTNTTDLQSTVTGRITDMDGKIASADTAKVAAEAAKAGAEIAKSAADTAKTDAETAQTLAENAKGAAEAAQGIAATAKTDALTAKNDSDVAKTNALAAQAASEAAKNSAQDWATKTTGAVSGGEYSAKYHASNASTDAGTATTKASTATTKANEASSSATSASGSASTATTKASEAAASATASAGSASTATSKAAAALSSASDAADSASEATDKAGNTAADAMDSADSAAEALNSANAAASSASTAAATLANKLDINGDGSQLTGIEAVINQNTKPTGQSIGAFWFDTDDKILNIHDGTDFVPVYVPPIVSTIQLQGKPSGEYDIEGASGINFTGYVENDIHGGGWLLIWNLDSRGATNVDYRGYNQTGFWTASGNYEGNNSTPYNSWYKGTGHDKFSNFTEIMIVAHDKGTGAYNNIDGSGGAFGSTYVIKPINASNINKTIYTMMNSGNNNTIATTTTSRGGTVGGDSYDRTSGQPHIDHNYDIVFNHYSDGNGGPGSRNRARIGTSTTPCSDISCNGHAFGGGFGGYHDRDGNYGINYTAAPAQGYHDGDYCYGTARQNTTGASTVSNNSPIGPIIQYVDFAIYVR